MSTSTDTRQRVAVVIYEDAAKDLARAYRGLMTAAEFLDSGAYPAARSMTVPVSARWVRLVVFPMILPACAHPAR